MLGSVPSLHRPVRMNAAYELALRIETLRNCFVMISSLVRLFPIETISWGHPCCQTTDRDSFQADGCVVCVQIFMSRICWLLREAPTGVLFTHWFALILRMSDINIPRYRSNGITSFQARLLSPLPITSFPMCQRQNK